MYIYLNFLPLQLRVLEFHIVAVVVIVVSLLFGTKSLREILFFFFFFKICQYLWKQRELFYSFLEKIRVIIRLNRCYCCSYCWLPVEKVPADCICGVFVPTVFEIGWDGGILTTFRRLSVTFFHNNILSWPKNFIFLDDSLLCDRSNY